jgi:hypothetical protein
MPTAKKIRHLCSKEDLEKMNLMHSGNRGNTFQQVLDMMEQPVCTSGEDFLKLSQKPRRALEN